MAGEGDRTTDAHGWTLMGEGTEGTERTGSVPRLRG